MIGAQHARRTTVSFASVRVRSPAAELRAPGRRHQRLADATSTTGPMLRILSAVD